MASGNSSMIECTELCPLLCDTYDFTVSLSNAPYPESDYYLNLLRNDTRIISKYSNITLISDNILSKSLTKINIYYDHLNYELQSEMESTIIFDLLSSLGGVLGLYFITI